jgi:NADP-dependent 3-hydroxy acid dehydrogenase YdfG
MKVLIIGGTSGIGWALAEHYLQAGHEVAVSGRDITKVKPEASKNHPKLILYQFDIADRVALISAIQDFSNSRIDLLIVSAGFYFNDRHHRLDEATSLRMLQTNVSGLSHAFEIAGEIMLQQKSGHLAAISSMAGLLKDYPGASLYSATKRSVIDICATYRKALAPFSIAVTTIIPGYINTEKLRQLNNGDASHKPFLLSEQQAVSRIVKAIAQRDELCVFPWQMHWLIRLLNVLPKQLLKLRK